METEEDVHVYLTGEGFLFSDFNVAPLPERFYFKRLIDGYSINVVFADSHENLNVFLANKDVAFDSEVVRPVYPLDRLPSKIFELYNRVVAGLDVGGEWPV